jgi:hypothetical protein
VQALTQDYVAEGFVQPVEMPLVGFLNMQNQTTFALSSVKLLPLALQAVVATETPAEVIIPKTHLIALIPLDEASRNSAALQMPPRSEKAALYAGPFIFQAALRLIGDVPLRNFFNTAVGNFFVASDAEITCLRTDSVFAPPPAPVILLSRALIQLYHPLG